MNDAIDKTTLMERVDDDMELLIDLVEIYEEDALIHLQSLKTASASQDGDLMNKAGHSLKGSSLNLSADHLAEMAQEMEVFGKEGNFGACNETMTKMETEFVRVMQELKIIIS